jgi:hypothetical protein
MSLFTWILKVVDIRACIYLFYVNLGDIWTTNGSLALLVH